jgi:hydroxymethylglutaryl-CoA reductase
MSAPGSSRIPGFYRLDVPARRRRVAELCGLDEADLQALDGGLTLEVADHMVENVIGTYGFPMAVALNFCVDGDDVLVPMAIEEPSVVAAASNAAKMIREGGGFCAEVSRALMIGQIQVTEVPDPAAAAVAITGARDQILSDAARLAPRLVGRGGGPVDLEVRTLAEPGSEGPGMIVVHLHIDCVDAMGANLVNSIAEGVADRVASLAGGRVGLRILSNLSDRRTVRVTARVPDSALDPTDGAAVRTGVIAASRFAELDPYRAATHNKGIMNGVDAVLLATGNDWRGVEAGAHAYAAATGTYRPLATWRQDAGALVGTLEMPLAVGTVGGALHLHAGARLALRILGSRSAARLAAVAASAGLASNLAALRALATDGIQRGHMSLHARVVARAAGASGDLIDRVAAEIAAAGDVKTDRAREIIKRLRAEEMADSTAEEPT